MNDRAIRIYRRAGMLQRLGKEREANKLFLLAAEADTIRER